MRKILVLTSILLFTQLLGLSQNSDALQTSKTVTYSESQPYQPRQFPNEQDKKSKKKKKSEKDEQIISQTQNVAVLPLKEEATITIPVSVFNAKGEVVTNLKQSDFKIYADDQEQEILSVSKQDKSVNVILLIDTSPSTAYKIEQIQNFALSTVERLRAEDKVMVIEFNEQLKKLTELTSDRQAITKAIRKIKFGDGTSLYEAIKNTFVNYIKDVQGQTIVLLMTDGVDTTSRKATYADSLLAAEKTNITVFPIYFDTYEDSNKMPKRSMMRSLPIGIFVLDKTLRGLPAAGSTIAEYEMGKMYLDDIARLSGGRPLVVQDITNTQTNNVNNFDEEIKEQYQITFRPSSFVAGQRKQIKVRVNRSNLFVLARGSLIADGNY